MVEAYRELGFDSLLGIASGLALAAYALRVILDPMTAALVAFGLVLIGVMTLVPQDARAPAAAIGVVAVGLAGIVIPRAVESVTPLPGGNELAVTAVASGLVLLLTFALLRLTAFRPRNGEPV